MLTSLILGAISAQASPKLETQTLANGVRLCAERTNSVGQAAVSVSFLIHGLGQAAESEGGVHLIEHLAARGPKKDLDHRLELAGMFMTASTSRDSLTLTVDCGPSQVENALRHLMEVTGPLSVTQAEIVKEVGTIREELAILSWTTRLARPAWQTAFGADSPDPQGDPSLMEKMTPAQLADFAQSLFVGNRTSVAVSGGIDPAAALEAASEVFSSLPRGSDLEEYKLPSAAKSGNATTHDAWGDGRAAAVLDCANTDTLATLAAALALAAHIKESTVVYTPSGREGVVILCIEGEAALKELDGLTQTMMNALAPSGVAMVKNWARTLGSSPSKSASALSSLRGQKRTLDLATVQKAASLVQVGLVGRKMNLFKKGNGIMVTSR